MTALLRFGFLADGVVKLLVALVYLLMPVRIAALLGTSAALLAVVAVLVALSGVAEAGFAVRSGAGTHTRYLIASDGSWVLAALIALAVGIGPDRAGGWIWLLVQGTGAIGIAVVFGRPALAQPARESAPAR